MLGAVPSCACGWSIRRRGKASRKKTGKVSDGVRDRFKIFLMSGATCHWFGAELLPNLDYSASSSREVFRIWDSIRYPLSLFFDPKNWKENVSIDP